MRIRILGVPIDAGTRNDALNKIQSWIKTRDLHHSVIVANVHLLTEAQHLPELMQAFDAASLAVTDGMPLVWCARKQSPQAERIVGVELMHALCQKGGRVFLLGGAQGVAEALGRKLCGLYPELILAGTACPPFRAWSAEEESALINTINQSHPDILFVAFGAPKQELWIHRNKAALQVPVCIGVGAAFDYALGRIARAPKWMQAAGFEWFFRLMQEPRRLWKRYAVSNMRFLLLLLKYRKNSM